MKLKNRVWRWLLTVLAMVCLTAAASAEAATISSISYNGYVGSSNYNTSTVSYWINATDSSPGSLWYLVKTTNSTPTLADPNWNLSNYWQEIKPAGFYSRYAWVKDEAGNISLPTTIIYRVDLTPPAKPVITPFPNSRVNTNNPVFIGSAESYSTILLYEGDVLMGNGTTNGSGAWTANYSTSLSEGSSHTVTATATDAAGNPSLASTAVTFTVDTTLPTTTANPLGGTKTEPIDVYLTVNEPATIYYTTNGVDPTTSSPSFTDNVGNVAKGPIAISTNTTLKYFAVDMAGNTETPIKQQVYFYGTSPVTDILWRNTSTGENYVWYMEGVTQTGGASLPTLPDLNWKIVGKGDFNGDGKIDLLWRNTATGENYVWYMNGVIQTGGASLPTLTDLNWTIAGIGDFNSDGNPDILWRNTATGENYVWYMNGVTQTNGASLPTLSDLSWTIAGIGDFDADGKSDILWRNTANGDNYVWYMNGVTQTDGASLLTLSDLSWTIAGIGDFNADGKPDILWRNTATGENYVWYMNGVTQTGGASLTTLTDLNWKIVGL